MCALLLVGVARAFGMVNHACARGVKSLRRKAKHMYYVERVENVSAFSNHTECEDIVVSQDDHALYLLR